MTQPIAICFFDLQKAFDTVQYPLLLKRVFDCGINGKAWRILNSWYTKPKCKIEVKGMLSSSITVECGVLQGSVLSPKLFLMHVHGNVYPLERDGLSFRNAVYSLETLFEASLIIS